jgi:hypothetical protein
MRNVVIGLVVLLLAIVLIGGVYAATRPQVTAPPVTALPTRPLDTPVAVPTDTPQPVDTAAPESQPPATPEAPPSEAPATDEVPTLPPTQEPTTVPTASTEVPTAVPPTLEPGASLIPGVEDQQIIVGYPVVLDDEFLPEVALLTQNVGELVKDYSLKATFKNGDTITATADGYISQHAPGTIRVATLYIDGEPGPTDTVTVAIDSLYDDDPSTEDTEIASRITFGPPTITTGDFPTVDIEVTNGSDSDLEILSIVAGVFRDGQLVGTASGTLSDMAAGQTKTATLYITGDIAETDQLLLTVDSLLAAE